METGPLFHFDLFGVAEEQFEALVDAGSLEVVALGMSCRLRAEVLLRQCETGTCPYVLSACDALSVTNRSGQIIIGLTW